MITLKGCLFMLKDVEVKEKEINLIFDLRTHGKFRFKEMFNIPNPYSPQLRKEDLEKSETKWYLEWMITYFVRKKEEAFIAKLLEDNPLKIREQTIYPYESPVLYKKAIECALISKQEGEELLKWVCDNKETLEKVLKVEVREHESNKKIIEINGLVFQYFNISLPLLVCKGLWDGSWIEVYLQKQQIAYSIQPYVFLCIPYDAFRKHGNQIIWTIHKENVGILDSLFKVFASVSKRHREDICKIFEHILSKLF